MSLVAAKCPNCGGNLEVDATKDAGVCPFCNTPYITQKAIINYNNTIINNTTINADTVNIVAGDFDKLMEKARSSFESDDVQDAYDSAVKALELNPKDTEAQLLKAICGSYLKRILSPAYTVFKSVFSNYELTKENAKFEMEYLSYYLNLIMTAYSATVDDYVHNVDVEGNLQNIFSAYEEIINNYNLAITLYAKLCEFDKSFEHGYIMR